MRSTSHTRLPSKQFCNTFPPENQTPVSTLQKRFIYFMKQMLTPQLLEVEEGQQQCADNVCCEQKMLNVCITDLLSNKCQIIEIGA